MSRVVIIAAGGKGSRWNNYLGVKKHDVKVEGVPILQRTIDQVNVHGDDPIVIKKGSQKYGDLDKIYSSKAHWNENGRTIILFGDVFFTYEALDKIMGHDEPGWTVFGRIGPSQVTGKPYGELFAVSFFTEHISKMERAIERVYKLKEREAIESANLWALYRAMHNFPDDLMNDHYAGKGLVTIDDWTEDFDWPRDYDTFIDRFEPKDDVS